MSCKYVLTFENSGKEILRNFFDVDATKFKNFKIIEDKNVPDLSLIRTMEIFKKYNVLGLQNIIRSNKKTLDNNLIVLEMSHHNLIISGFKTAYEFLWYNIKPRYKNYMFIDELSLVNFSKNISSDYIYNISRDNMIVYNYIIKKLIENNINYDVLNLVNYPGGLILSYEKYFPKYKSSVPEVKDVSVVTYENDRTVEWYKIEIERMLKDYWGISVNIDINYIMGNLNV